MKIAAVQLRPIIGDVETNIIKHVQFVQLAAAQGVDLLFFPELSLSGYEPYLARSLAMRKDDPRLDVLQQESDRFGITVGVGLPLAAGNQVQIGMVWFTPNAPRQTYAKQQLHADEFPFFAAGDEQLLLRMADHILAPAICYESLRPDHAQDAAHLSADVYLASVAKPAHGIGQAMVHFPAIAARHGLLVLMANAVGPCDNFVSAGRSAVWDRQGALLVQMDAESEGMVIVDTEGTMSAYPWTPENLIFA